MTGGAEISWSVNQGQSINLTRSLKMKGVFVPLPDPGAPIRKMISRG